MLSAGEPPLLGSSGDVAVPAPAMAAYEAAGGVDGGGEVGSNSGEDEKLRGDEGDRGFSGNRWPRQETLALLKIRSDMDQVFRDSSLKGPLWEQVSRKLAELGYHRSAKKCKEKFENVYKYHKRTKDGRTGKPEGKHYKFFDQLEALYHHHNHSSSKPQPSTTMPSSTNPPTANAHINNIISSSPSPINASTQNTVTSALPPPITTNPTISTALPAHAMNNNNNNSSPYPNAVPTSFPNLSNHLFSSSTSSSTASDEECEVGLGKRKRTWKEFFKRLTKEVMKKQEELQDKFLEAIEKREQERMVREESWRIQEMARINREHEILIQERSTAAAKDAAVIAFLQKISGQQQNPVQTRENNNSQPPDAPPLELATRPQPRPPPQPPATAINFGSNYNGESTAAVMPSSSRWPKAEVQALIRFRTELSLKYQENGPKGPLWEEISAAMRSIGYNRSAKRCKEKWENINKYFKKVKESNKKRSEDSKTCPYYEQLDALYKEKSKTHDEPLNSMVPLMVQPEQQWPLQPHSVLHREMERNDGDQIQEDEDEEEEDDGETEDEYEGGSYEIVANKQQQQQQQQLQWAQLSERQDKKLT